MAAALGSLRRPNSASHETPAQSGLQLAQKCQIPRGIPPKPASNNRQNAFRPRHHLRMAPKCPPKAELPEAFPKHRGSTAPKRRYKCPRPIVQQMPNCPKHFPKTGGQWPKDGISPEAPSHNCPKLAKPPGPRASSRTPRWRTSWNEEDGAGEDLSDGEGEGRRRRRGRCAERLRRFPGFLRLRVIGGGKGCRAALPPTAYPRNTSSRFHCWHKLNLSIHMSEVGSKLRF